MDTVSTSDVDAGAAVMDLYLLMQLVAVIATKKMNVQIPFSQDYANFEIAHADKLHLSEMLQFSLESYFQCLAFTRIDNVVYGM